MRHFITRIICIHASTDIAELTREKVLNIISIIISIIILSGILSFRVRFIHTSANPPSNYLNRNL